VLQLRTKGLELAEPHFDAGQLFRGQLAGFLTGLAPPQQEKHLNFIQAEAGGLGALDELKRGELGGAISPDLAVRPHRLPQQLSSFVVSDGLDVDSSGSRQSPDRIAVIHPLDPVPNYGRTLRRIAAVGFQNPETK
jgi:hypothetical protein